MGITRKKLIEVALPLVAINKGCQQEKNPFLKGHPRNMHLWWARRPLAACRAVLFSSLVDDPDYDPAYRKLDGTVDFEAAGVKRAELFNLIEDLVKWENTNNPAVLNKARADIARCVASRKIELGELDKQTIVFGPQEGKKHSKGPVSGKGLTAWEVVIMAAPPQVVNHFLANYAPPVLDPFAGGGSIPLEAQRLGLRAYASDLNPVAVLINKALIEIPPKFANLPPVNPEYQSKSKSERQLTQWHGAQGLAADVRYWGQWMRDQAEKRIGHFYPKVKITAQMAKDRPDLKDYVGRELTVIAWLWARTVASHNPACKGAYVPLISSFWLSTKKGKEAWIWPIIDRTNNIYHFEVHVGQPRNTEKDIIKQGTKLGRGCKFRCLLSDQPIPENHIKTAGTQGHLNTCLLAIVAEGTHGRVYLSPTPEQESIAATVHEIMESHGIDAPLANDPRNLWCLGYGLNTFDKLFTPRQLTALTTFSDLVMESGEQIAAEARKTGTFPQDVASLADGGIGPAAYADAIVTYLAFGVTHLSRYSATLCGWNNVNQNVAQVFGRQALPMVWDFAECNPIEGVLSVTSTVEWPTRVLENLSLNLYMGSVKQLDATASINGVKDPLISTDPPYYDNISYADLSDFFYVWLRRSLSKIYPQLFATLLTPKTQELIANPYRYEGDRDFAQEFFRKGFDNTFLKIRETQNLDFPMTVYYAFKQAETDESDEEESTVDTTIASTGWETMLIGLIKSGFTIEGTWPIRTEREKGLKGNVNSLASSIVLVCRPRSAEAPLATRREFIAALKNELPPALHALQRGNIAPVDLAQAAIGPGMSVFTRYAKVMESNGSAMTVRTALGLINQILDEVLAEQEGEFDADTRWAIAWFEQYGMEEGPYGVAEILSKAKNTAVNGLVEAGVLAARGGKVHLLKRDQLPADWDPATDRRLTIWEAVQHLIRTLDQEGEQAAAALLRKLGGLGETVRDLAYRLYMLCERKKWAQEALAYNMLVVAWPEISRLARSAPAETPRKPKEKELFE